MILTELIGSVHTFIAAFYYSLVNTKNTYMAICQYGCTNNYKYLQ